MPFLRRPRPRATVVGTGEALTVFEIRETKRGGRLDLPPGTVRFDGASMHGVDFQGQRIANFVAVGSTFDECTFRNVVISAGVLSHMPPVVYRSCDFSGADLRKVSPLTARFERCTFDGALLKEWSAVCAEFVECHFAGRLERVKFCGQPLGPCAKLLSGIRTRNEFSRNDFAHADLIDCRISGGIDIADQTWPSGTEYVHLDDLQARIRKAQRVVEVEWPPGRDRDRALRLMELYSSRDYAAQQGLILRRDDVYDHGQWTERLISLLKES